MELKKEIGVKYDQNKLRYDLVCPLAQEEFVRVLTFGANKYAPDNWKKVDTFRYIAALGRHINAWRKGEKNDKETNIHHLAHAMCNIMFLLSRELEEK